MGELFRPHFVGAFGVTFPMVAQVLDGWRELPRPLRRIPPPDRDRLVATMACELAMAATRQVVCVPHAYDYWEAEVILPLMAELGGARFVELLRADSRASSAYDDAMCAYLRLGHRGWLSACVLCKTQNGSIHLTVHKYLKQYAPDILRQYKADVRRSLEGLKRMGREYTQARAALVDCMDKIEGDAAYRETVARRSWPRPDVLFGAECSQDNFGLQHFLRNNDPDWWSEFGRRIRRRIRHRAVSRWWAFRDPGCCGEVAGKVKTTTWDDAMADLIALLIGQRAERQRWGLLTPVTAAISRSVRETLRAQDEFGLGWLKQRGKHSNPYTRWLGDLLANEESHLVPKDQVKWAWVHSLAQKYLVDDCSEISALSAAQLLWCISRPQARYYPYAPSFSGPQAQTLGQQFSAWCAEMEKLLLVQGR